MIVVTHYQRLLNYIVPDYVHVLVDGAIVHSGGKELALELEEKGYGWLEKEPPPARAEAERNHHGSDRPGKRPVQRQPRGFEEKRPGEPGWLVKLRREAFERFSSLGFPTTRNEEWKYTSVAPIAKVPFRTRREPASPREREGVEGAAGAAAFRIRQRPVRPRAVRKASGRGARRKPG